MGIIDNEKGVNKNTLQKMQELLYYRGPNDAGSWINSDKTVGLAHRRLSIIDLSIPGHQPMSDEGEKMWIVYNGEVYNFLEIREELEAKGYRFRSNTDTEVELYSYKEWGVPHYVCLLKLYV